MDDEALIIHPVSFIEFAMEWRSCPSGNILLFLTSGEKGTVSNPIGIKRTVLSILQADTKKMLFACCACFLANYFTEAKNYMLVIT